MKRRERLFASGLLAARTPRVVVLLSVVFAMFVAACGGGEEAGGGGAKEVTISYQVPALKFPFFVYQRHFLEDAARKIGNVKIVTADAENSAERQTANVEAAVTRQVDGIVISPLTEEQLVPAVTEAHDANIPVVTIDRALAGGETLAHVGADNVEVGRVAAQYVVDKLGGKGKVVLLTGTPGASAAVDREKGAKEVLAKHPGIKIVFNQTANFARDEGLRVTEDAIQAVGDFDALLSGNDDMALGAVEALKARGLLGKVLVVGTDAIPEALESIKKGEQDATVEQFGNKQAEQALKTVVDFIRNKTEPAKHTTLLKPLLIDKGNLDQAVEKK